MRWAPLVDAGYMNSLYALKPWYSQRLTGVLRVCVTHNVAPATLTWVGVGAGISAGLALATTPAGPLAALLVGGLLVLRLGCANLDGGLARATGRSSRWGSVENELGDRLADFGSIAGLLVLVPTPWALAALAATTLPSWAALAGQAAGSKRINGGPMGKTERCVVLVAIAALGPSGWLVGLLVVGSVATATVRLVRVHHELESAR